MEVLEGREGDEWLASLLLVSCPKESLLLFPSSLSSSDVVVEGVIYRTASYHRIGEQINI